MILEGKYNFIRRCMIMHGMLKLLFVVLCGVRGDMDLRSEAGRLHQELRETLEVGFCESKLALARVHRLRYNWNGTPV